MFYKLLIIPLLSTKYIRSRYEPVTFTGRVFCTSCSLLSYAFCISPLLCGRCCGVATREEGKQTAPESAVRRRYQILAGVVFVHVVTCHDGREREWLQTTEKYKNHFLVFLKERENFRIKK
jgi:hypothetical protein